MFGFSWPTTSRVIKAEKILIVVPHTAVLMVRREEKLEGQFIEGTATGLCIIYKCFIFVVFSFLLTMVIFTSG